MSCYHPRLMVNTHNINLETGHEIYSFVKNVTSDRLKSVGHDEVVVPCGKCLGCRLDYSRAWADRMMLELETSKKAVFVTLTYNDDHVPVRYDEDTGELLGFSLDKRDCQLFLKNLRRDYDGKDGHPNVKIRFYAAGEYGPTGTKRPHMHLIIFGLGIDDFPLKIPFGMNELKQQYYRVPELERCWMDFTDEKNPKSKGFVLVSDVSWKTFAYVARYVLKKAKADVGPDAAERGLEPEFVLMSRRPGIGRDYLDMNPGCLDYVKIPVSDVDGCREIYIPQYYLNQAKKKCDTFPQDLRLNEWYDKMKLQRKEMAIDANMRKLQNTTLMYLDQLAVEEELKKSQMNTLRRDKV